MALKSPEFTPCSFACLLARASSGALFPAGSLKERLRSLSVDYIPFPRTEAGTRMILYFATFSAAGGSGAFQDLPAV